MVEDETQEGHGAEAGQRISPVAGESVSREEEAAEEDRVPKVEAQGKELQELQDRYLRLAAEFDNYRKRVGRDRADVVRAVQEGLLSELLPVLDNLERALAAARASAGSSRAEEAVIEGVEMTLRLFKGVLEKEGVKAIESVGQPFDPTIHHAVEQVRTSDQPENTVVEEVLRGYLLNHKVLRPALVKVSAAPVPPSAVGISSEEAEGE
jgi:molecular chaperone GrpE